MASPRPRKPSKKAGSPAPEARAASAKAGREFVAEAEELLERLCADLALLHEQRHAGGEPAPELVHGLFRSAHTLKGLAGLFGFDVFGRLAHRLEDVLDGLRLGRIPARAPVVGMLDDGVALLLALVAGAEDDAAVAERAAARAESFLLELDHALAAPGDATTGELAEIGLDPAIVRALTEYEEHRLRHSVAGGRPIALVDATFELDRFEEGLAEISTAAREGGEIIATLPTPSADGDGRICFTLVVATELAPDRLERRLAELQGTLRIVHPGRVAAAKAAGASADERRIESLRSISGSVRVDISKLDVLMNLVGEMMSQRNALAKLAVEAAANPSTGRIGAELMKAQKLLDRRLKALQAGVLDARMVPLRQVFDKLSRVIRRLRVDLAKEVELEFLGGDTELDKLIVEQLVDPLVHVVRNAFDHALESPDERSAAGKSPIGTIRIAALQRGNHVVLEVADDGRGMDLEAIRRRAIEAGIVSEQAALSEREILNLVFEAGLSTRATVSETSGRGVGMDIVRSNLAALGGLVEVASRTGAGTTITITLPITLAILQALIVRVGEERFAIPLASIEETLRVADHPILRSEYRELIDLRGEPLILRRLAEEFELQSNDRAEAGFVVVLAMGGQRLGLLVDGLDGQQDIVIKPIQGPIQALRGIAGATELADRRPLLVIDVSSFMIEQARRREAA